MDNFSIVYVDQYREANLLHEAKEILEEVKTIFQKNPKENRIKLPISNKSDNLFKIIAFLALSKEYQFLVYRPWFGLCKSKLVFVKEECLPGNPYPYSSKHKGGLV